jgi:hypothetical protein
LHASAKNAVKSGLKLAASPDANDVASDSLSRGHADNYEAPVGVRERGSSLTNAVPVQVAAWLHALEIDAVSFALPTLDGTIEPEEITHDGKREPIEVISEKVRHISGYWLFSARFASTSSCFFFGSLRCSSQRNRNRGPFDRFLQPG